MGYDLIVIGSGPAGQKGAIAAAKLGKRVAVIERKSPSMGGVCLHTGTIPSKTIREAILHLTGFRHRDIYGERYQRHSITMQDLRRKVSQVQQHELNVIQDQFDSNGINVHFGEASFVSPHEIRVTQGSGSLTLSTEHFLVASGTRPSRPSHVPFDGKTVFDSDEFLALEKIPRTMVVVGAGVIGIEYAIMFAALGVKVTVVDGRKTLLEFCDTEILEGLLHHARSLGMSFRLGEEMTQIDLRPDGRVAVQMESGKRVLGETVLFSAGRQGDTDALNIAAAGLQLNNRGRLPCDADFRTEVPNIFAVGDVVGFPALASTAMEQGRCAVARMFGIPFTRAENIPFGLFTIPEVSMVGKTEQQLTDECIPYEVGTARYQEIARGQINGDQSGMLKILFHRETGKVLGVHCLGDSATELVHIGQAVMSLNGRVDYFRDAVFNYPTLAECYKVAAFDGINRLDDPTFSGATYRPKHRDLNEVEELLELSIDASERELVAN